MIPSVKAASPPVNFLPEQTPPCADNYAAYVQERAARAVQFGIDHALQALAANQLARQAAQANRCRPEDELAPPSKAKKAKLQARLQAPQYLVGPDKENGRFRQDLRSCGYCEQQIHRVKSLSFGADVVAQLEKETPFLRVLGFSCEELVAVATSQAGSQGIAELGARAWGLHAQGFTASDLVAVALHNDYTTCLNLFDTVGEQGPALLAQGFSGADVVAVATNEDSLGAARNFARLHTHGIRWLQLGLGGSNVVALLGCEKGRKVLAALLEYAPKLCGLKFAGEDLAALGSSKNGLKTLAVLHRYAPRLLGDGFASQELIQLARAPQGKAVLTTAFFHGQSLQGHGFLTAQIVEMLLTRQGSDCVAFLAGAMPSLRAKEVDLAVVLAKICQPESTLPQLSAWIAKVTGAYGSGPRNTTSLERT